MSTDLNFFNFIGSCYVLPCIQVIYTDSPLVTSAPTGSGKTVIFELAIIRLLMQTEEQMAASKVVYGKKKNGRVLCFPFRVGPLDSGHVGTNNIGGEILLKCNFYVMGNPLFIGRRSINCPLISPEG